MPLSTLIKIMELSQIWYHLFEALFALKTQCWLSGGIEALSFTVVAAVSKIGECEDEWSSSFTVVAAVSKTGECKDEGSSLFAAVAAVSKTGECGDEESASFTVVAAVSKIGECEDEGSSSFTERQQSPRLERAEESSSCPDGLSCQIPMQMSQPVVVWSGGAWVFEM